MGTEAPAAALVDPAVTAETVAEITYPPSPRADWYHVLAVLEELREEPPSLPLVVLLGGSCGRECTVSDEGWSAEVVAAGGPAVVARNLSSRNKTFRHDLDLVRLLPSTRVVVLIGVNLGRFTGWPTPGGRGPASLPEDLEFRHDQHHYSLLRTWSAERRECAVRQWLRDRLHVFEARCGANLAMLERVVLACRDRGFEPALVELPRDEEAIGGRFDVAVARYQAGCRALAAASGVPFIDFVDEVGLVSADFYDLMHLVEPGRVKWQRRLASATAELLGEER
ncbi:MAG TPA: hypothetical protein VLA35_06825 [Thermoleophilia bacterium]|nr:hypothetical protein [Thermoleophilia bacterium]